MIFKKFISHSTTALILTILFVPVAFAQGANVSIEGADLYLGENSVSLSKDSVLEGETVRVYITVSNGGNQDVLGTVKLLNSNSVQVGTDQIVSVVAGKTDTVFVDWVPEFGNQQINVTVLPWETEGDNPNNNNFTFVEFVLQDSDRDRIPNTIDTDDDNDGTIDAEDDFPLNRLEQKDTDADGQGDNADADDDNDGTPDIEDDLPLDPTETEDTDNDGIGDNADPDDDNDGLSDLEELGNTVSSSETNTNNSENTHESTTSNETNSNSGGSENTDGNDVETLSIEESNEGDENQSDSGLTDPKNPDTDGDGVLDGADAFPTDPQESGDFDQDGIGDNADDDADNDGIAKEDDVNDTNTGPTVKLSDKVSIISPGETLNLDASPSSDEDGEIVSYEWEILNVGSTETDETVERYSSPEINHTFTEPGKYAVKLKLTDDKGESRTKEYTVRVFDFAPYIKAGLVLIFALALYLGFKYTAGAKKPKKQKKTAKKASKKPKK